MDRPEIRDRLTEVRTEELALAAKIIGYDEVLHLGYRDSGMPDTEPNHHPAAFVNADPETALERVVAIIRSRRPEVVLGYDEHKRYPHPDHVRIHDLGLAAFDAAADPHRFPEAGPPWEVARLYAPVFTARRLRTLHEAMEERGMESPFTEWLDRIDDADDEDHTITSVEVTATIERGRDALRAHATQVDPDGFWFRVPVEVAVQAYPFEDFRLLAGRSPVPGEATDLFAGL